MRYEKLELQLWYMYPPLAAKVDTLLKEMAACGNQSNLGCALRSEKEQEALFEQGRSLPGPIVTTRKFGMHCLGLAVDLYPKYGPCPSEKALYWPALGKQAEALGLTWGGSWRTFRDFPHVQWKTRYTLDQLEALYQTGGIIRVWEELEKEQNLPFPTTWIPRARETDAQVKL